MTASFLSLGEFEYYKKYFVYINESKESKKQRSASLIFQMFFLRIQLKMNEVLKILNNKSSHNPLWLKIKVLFGNIFYFIRPF